MRDLTIVCISKVEPFSPPFLFDMETLAYRLGADFLLACDGGQAYAQASSLLHYTRLMRVDSKGYLESVHDDVIRSVETRYVLRLDDDEKASPAMVRWLVSRSYCADDHWKFARANLISPKQYIVTSHLWKDHQTRLSVRSKAIGRTALHCGSPYGGGREAPVAIEHYKFIVKSLDERRRIAANYDRVMAGAGTGGMAPFTLPEVAYGDQIPTELWNDGTVR